MIIHTLVCFCGKDMELKSIDLRNFVVKFG